MRIPVKIVGTAAGKTTWRNVATGERPSTFADRSSCGSTVATPVIVLSRIGKKQA